MTDERIETLMHEVLDGTASPADCDRLESLLVADPALRSRYTGLKQAHELLVAAPREAAPSELLPSVMSLVNKDLASPVRAGRPLLNPFDAFLGLFSAPLTTGGRNMKKVLLGVGALAVVGIVYIGLKGDTTKNTTGVEGTIGVANRYQENQIATGDVVLGDESINDILQTELFHELVTNPDFRKLVTSEEFQKIAGSDAFKGFIANPEVQKAYATIDYERNRIALMKNVQSGADLEKFVAESPELSKLTATSEFRKLLATSPEAARTLLSPELGKLVSSSDGFRNAFLKSDYGKIVSRPEFQKAMAQSDAERRQSY